MPQSISALPIGSKIKFGKYKVESETPESILWQIADKNHTGYPANSITLLTDKIIDLRAFDAKEPSNSDSNRQSYGNNRYRDSNIRQWLNKGGYPWYVATHGADAPPTDSATNNYGTGYDDHTGFLENFTSDELGVILDTTLTVALNTVTDGGGSEIVTDKVFLLSNTEVGLANENSIAEGNLLPIFSDDTSRISELTSQAFTNTLSTSKPSTVNDPWYWWLRTPHASDSGYARGVGASGALNSNNACIGSGGVRPALNLKSDILVSDEPDVDGAYTIEWNQVPIILVSEMTFPNVKFTASDNDGTVQSARVLLNGIEKQTYDAIEVQSEMTYTILYDDLNEGDNQLKIEATDDQGATGEKNLNVNKTGIDTPPIGTKIILQGKEYEITDIADGGLTMTLTLDRGLEENTAADESIEILTNNVFPYANMGSGYLPFDHVKTKEKDSKMLVEYILNSEGREFQLKMDMQKKTGTTFEVEQPKAIFGYKED